MYRVSFRWWNWKPRAGFRFSLADAAAIGVCALAAWAIWPLIKDVAVLFPVVLGHFFLFCNVFRIPRSSELLWSGVFVINVAVWLSIGRFSWPAVLITQTPLTILLITLAVLRSDYHGIGYSLVPWGRECVDAGVTQQKKP